MDIKKCIINLKSFLKYYLGKHQYQYTLKDKNIFIFLSADYGNLGDIAITFAQKKFLMDYFPDYNLFEIPISYTYNE